MRTRPIAVCVMLGAVAGGLVVGPFGVEPAWLWGMVAGLTGGAAAGTAAWMMGRPWPPVARWLGALAVLALGFGVLWYVSAGQWVQDPANWEVRPQ